MAVQRGILITFEGGDGAGKSSQVAILVDRLRSLGYPADRAYEPGGTPLGNALRGLLLDASVPIQPLPELLLFSAARAENVETVIKPALKSGRLVVCDRFTDSTVAYQGYGKGLDLELIHVLNKVAANGTIPALTFLLDIDPEVALRRVSVTGSSGDKIEGHLQLGLAMSDPLAGPKRRGGWEIDVHRKIRAGYLDIAAKEPERWSVLDATQPVEEVAEQVWSDVEALLIQRSEAMKKGPLLSRLEGP